MNCPICNAIMEYKVTDSVQSYKGKTVTVPMDGWVCSCGFKAIRPHRVEEYRRRVEEAIEQAAR